LKEQQPDEALKIITEVIDVRENLDANLFSDDLFKGQKGMSYLIKAQCLRDLAQFDEARKYLDLCKYPILEFYSEFSEQWIN